MSEFILKEKAAADVATPDTDKFAYFVDSATGNFSKKDSLGVVTDIEAATAGVASFEGRIGAVTAQAGDYIASEITNTPAGDISATNVQTAINELDTEKLTVAHAGATGAAHGVVTGAVNGFMIAADKTKLDGVASGATANQTDAYLLDRTNHTGTQSASTVTGLATVATSGAYGDLSGTPSSLPPNGAAGGDLGGSYPNPTIATLVGDSGSGGTKGLVPAPVAGSAVLNRILKADGTWTANFPDATPAEAARAVGTWEVKSASAANQWIDVTWAPELRKFVAIASSGTDRVMYSGDGVTWTAATAAAANLWTSICWSPELNLFVAVSFDGANQVMTSPDGITWTPQTASLSAQWYRVVWAPALGLFVATSLNGATRVMTSPDGVNWTNQTSPIAQWYSLTWSPELNLLVAVALGGSIMTSPDGVNWSTQTGVGSNDWYDIAWSPELGKFAAVGITGTRTMSSPDGITWTAHTAPTDSWRRITWAPFLGMFIAVSSSGTIMTSLDGDTWTSRTSPQPNQWYGVAWSHDLKVAVITGITGTNRVLNSTYVGGFLSGGLVGPTGATGPAGATGATGPANPNGAIPSASVNQTSQQTTTSASFVDIPGLSTTITTTALAPISAVLTAVAQCTLTTAVGEFRVVIDAQNGTAMALNFPDITTQKGVSAELLSTPLAAGTYTVKAQYRETSGLGTLALNMGSLVAIGVQASAPYTMSQAVRYEEDWVSPAVTGNLAWTSTVSGTGAANTKVTTQQTSNRAGIIQFSTGTTATGRGALALATDNHFFGGGVATFETAIYIPTLSDASNEYSIRVGMGDVVTGADFVDGVYFEYVRTTSVNWSLKTALNSARTLVDSTVAVAAGAWIKLKAVVNDNGTNVDYYINGTLVGSVTTNIPVTVARVCSPALVIAKSVGTTARTMLADYFSYEQVFTTPR